MLGTSAPPQSRDGAFLSPKEGSMSIKALERVCDWMTRFVFAAVALLALACVSPAYADTPGTSVTIPWGDWLSAFIVQVIMPILGVIIAAFVTWAVARLAPLLPAGLRSFITAQNTAAAEQLLSRAVGYALNKAALDTKGQAIAVPVGNAQVGVAVDYAVTHGAPALVDWLGGAAGIQQKIVARLPATSVTTPPAAPVAPAAS
jgi:hypothetical protein